MKSVAEHPGYVTPAEDIPGARRLLEHTLQQNAPMLRRDLPGYARKLGCPPEEITYILAMLDHVGADHPLTRAEYEARYAAGETFVLDIQALVRSDVRRASPRWPRDLLDALDAPQVNGCVRVAVQGFGQVLVTDLQVQP